MNVLDSEFHLFSLPISILHHRFLGYISREMEGDVSRWPLEAELGVGTFSKVFSSTDQQTSASVVLKYPLLSEAASMLEKEAKTLASLQVAKCKRYL